MMISRTRSSKRKLGIYMAALMATFALGAGAASGAQAFEWQVGQRSLEGLNLASVHLTGSGESFSITSVVLGQPVKLACGSAVGGGSILPGGGGTSPISLSKCSVAAPAKCNVPSPLVLDARIELIEHSGKIYEKLVPQTGTALATIVFGGPECVLNEAEVPLKGAIVGAGLLSENYASKSLAFSPAINSETGATLTLGGQPASLSGTIGQELQMPFTGEPWRALPGASKEAGEPNTNWQVAGVGLKSAQNLGFEGGPVAFNFTLAGGNPLSFSCNSVGANNATIIAAGTQEARLVFSGCKVAKPLNCTMPSTLTFEQAQGSLETVAGTPYMVFRSTNTANEFLYSLELRGGSCAIAGRSMAISGPLVASVPATNYVAEKSFHTLEFSETANAALNTYLHIGEGWGSANGTVTQRLLSNVIWRLNLPGFGA